MESNEIKQERVLLVAGYLEDENISYSLNELENLAVSNNLKVIEKVSQKLIKINPALYIGKGKVEEIKELCEYNEIDLVLFNDELTAVQMKNLEESLKTKVIDRTFLILEIFSKRAQTKEAKLQVRVAKLKYELPRVRGSYTKFERQRGGGGAANKGIGEGLIALDKRRIEQKITALEKELKIVEKQHDVKVKQQKKRESHKISLVGYTNAGKSTLMNRLTHLEGDDQVYAEDLLFATLTTTTRKFPLIDKMNITLSDTVGFVDKLPTELIKAFKTTLNEALDSDIIIHLIDNQSPYVNEQIETVDNTLADLDVDFKKVIRVYNKCDDGNMEADKIMISALKNKNIDVLKDKLRTEILKSYQKEEMTLDYSDYSKIDHLRKRVDIVFITETRKDDGLYVTYYKKI